MKHRFLMHIVAFLIMTAMIIGIPRLVEAEDIYLPLLLGNEGQSSSSQSLSQSLDDRPTPTATPSEFGLLAKVEVPSAPQYRETIDLAPDLPDEEKALMIFINEKGSYVNYLVAPSEIRTQGLRLSEEFGIGSLQIIEYPEQRHPEITSKENATPLSFATPDPSFVHPEVPVPPTPDLEQLNYEFKKID